MLVVVAREEAAVTATLNRITAENAARGCCQKLGIRVVALFGDFNVWISLSCFEVCFSFG